ncbi:Hypothetical protein NGAL_HAMBI2566_48900 [Neorhizobium galegae bv. orientalis]|nr:Hypothetical protein NGAL_HAMBI2566_48900 [Neorhizobium galegae bv. orientalis]
MLIDHIEIPVTDADITRATTQPTCSILMATTLKLSAKTRDWPMPVS